MSYIYDEIVKQNADGVDFMPIWFDEDMPPIIRSYTREEFEAAESFPKTNWRLWKNINGDKTYIPWEGECK